MPRNKSKTTACIIPRQLQLYVLRYLVNFVKVDVHFKDMDDIASVIEKAGIIEPEEAFYPALCKIRRNYNCYADMDNERLSLCKKFVSLINKRHASLEKNAPYHEGIIWNKVCEINQNLTLKPNELEFLHFCAAMTVYDDIKDQLETIKRPESVEQLKTALLQTLQIDHVQLRQLLSSSCSLFRNGLLENMDSYRTEIVPATIDRSIALYFQNFFSSIDELQKSKFQLAPACELTNSDYPHLNEKVHLLHRFLHKQFQNKPRPGVNILLYGRPGTGKTELARMIAQQLKLDLYEVSMKDYEGDPISDSTRLQYFRFGQAMMKERKNTMILFDELEDIFPVSFNFFGMFNRASGRDKAWFNQLLESNPIPTIWISNEVMQLDESMLRRFDIVFEVVPPTRIARKRIANRYLKNTDVSNKFINHIATQANVMPSDIMSCTRVVKEMEVTKTSETEKLLDNLLQNKLSARNRNYDSYTQTCQTCKTLHYDIDYINASFDVHTLVEGLQQNPTGRFCFMGPPGTGKSALGRHIADLLQRPVIEKRASDLLDMYVGGTEQNLRQMFHEARQDNAVLILDEADSFFRSREIAQRSWEVTQVNEILVQMERFPGLFIATTNLFKDFDTASLRRFDIKIEFNYMTSEQLLRMFTDTLKQQSPKSRVNDLIKQRLQHINTATPGDFHAILRRSRFTKTTINAQWLINELEQEQSLKQENRNRAIGFTVPV